MQHSTTFSYYYICSYILPNSYSGKNQLCTIFFSDKYNFKEISSVDFILTKILPAHSAHSKRNFHFNTSSKLLRIPLNLLCSCHYSTENNYVPFHDNANGKSISKLFFYLSESVISDFLEIILHPLQILGFGITLTFIQFLFTQSSLFLLAIVSCFYIFIVSMY